MERKELAELIIDLFTNNDIRYYRPDEAGLVAEFILLNAIELQKQDNLIPELIEDIKIEGPQENIKRLALIAIKRECAEFVGFERTLPYGRVDVLAKKSETNILIECGPCRINKTILYLREDHTELWLIPGAFFPNNYSEFYKVTRGKNWDKIIEKYDKILHEELRKIESPLDTMMKEKINAKEK